MCNIEKMKKIQSDALELFTKNEHKYTSTLYMNGFINILKQLEYKLETNKIKKNGNNGNEENIQLLLEIHNYTTLAILHLSDKT